MFTLSHTSPNSSPVESCLAQESQAKQARWKTWSWARLIQSVWVIGWQHLEHLVPYSLQGNSYYRD